MSETDVSMPNPEGGNGGAGQPAGAINTGRLVDAPVKRLQPRVPAAALDRGAQADAGRGHAGGSARLPSQQGIINPGGQ